MTKKVLTLQYYNYDENRIRGRCPVCSSQRKKKTQECLMLDWERGLGTCQHCGEILQLHTYKFEKDSNAVNYITPKTIVSQSTSDGVINWFKTRNISEETVKDLKVTNGNEYMPQV